MLHVSSYWMSLNISISWILFLRVCMHPLLTFQELLRSLKSEALTDHVSSTPSHVLITYLILANYLSIYLAAQMREWCTRHHFYWDICIFFHTYQVVNSCFASKKNLGFNTNQEAITPLTSDPHTLLLLSCMSTLFGMRCHWERRPGWHSYVRHIVGNFLIFLMKVPISWDGELKHSLLIGSIGDNCITD